MNTTPGKERISPRSKGEEGLQAGPSTPKRTTTGEEKGLLRRPLNAHGTEGEEEGLPRRPLRQCTEGEEERQTHRPLKPNHQT